MSIVNRIFLDKMQWLENQDLPFVAFKLPNSDKAYLIHQNNTNLYKIQDFSEKGFVINAFDGYEPYFIKLENYFESPFLRQEMRYSSEINCSSVLFNQQQYVELVEKAIDQIKNTELSKVVTSQKITQIAENQYLYKYFQTLIQRFPSAFCYVLSHPKLGKWMAATPETLLKIEDNYFETMSLAGTQLFVENQEPVWGKKEKNEQKIVTDTILERLTPLATHLQTSQVQNVRAGNLWHLCTHISGNFKSENTISNVIKALHPTPAVCGYPTEKAQNFIKEHENYDRKFYTGFCGVLNFPTPKKSNIFVNLRCLEKIDSQLHIYVGGGITQESAPWQEFEEIKNKAQNMFRIIHDVHDLSE